METAKTETSQQAALTPREQEIYDMLLNGKKPKEIADSLCVSYDTIKSHQKSIYRKFGVKNINEFLVKFKTDGDTSAHESSLSIKRVISAAALAVVIMFAAALVLYFQWKNEKTSYVDKWNAIADVNSTINLDITREKINGKNHECVTISGVLYDDENCEMTPLGYYGWGTPFAGTYGMPKNLTTKNLRSMKTISMKVMGDGNEYFLRLPTSETAEGDHWLLVFPTVKDEIITITAAVPGDFSRLGWSEKDVEFIQEHIMFLQIQAVRPGPYNLKFWDIRVKK
jgi:DNA-binding CsgD family transcriptional regulator